MDCIRIRLYVLTHYGLTCLHFDALAVMMRLGYDAEIA